MWGWSVTLGYVRHRPLPARDIPRVREDVLSLVAAWVRSRPHRAQFRAGVGGRGSGTVRALGTVVLDFPCEEQRAGHTLSEAQHTWRARLPRGKPRWHRGRGVFSVEGWAGGTRLPLSKIGPLIANVTGYKTPLFHAQMRGTGRKNGPPAPDVTTRPPKKGTRSAFPRPDWVMLSITAGRQHGTLKRCRCRPSVCVPSPMSSSCSNVSSKCRPQSRNDVVLMFVLRDPLDDRLNDTFALWTTQNDPRRHMADRGSFRVAARGSVRADHPPAFPSTRELARLLVGP